MCVGMSGPARRAVRLVFALATTVALPVATARLFSQSIAPGGFVELATSTAVRPLMTPGEIQRLLPARGTFTFPPPYRTEGIRLTNAADCSGADCVGSVGGSSWRNINNHVGRSTMYVLLTLDRKRGGDGPTLFKFNKTTGDVTKVGPLFDAAHALSWATGDGWYFSATRPTTVYINDGAALKRYDVLSHRFETVLDVSTEKATFGSNREIWQARSSGDDRVHSATLRDATSLASLGCLAYREDTTQFFFYPQRGSSYETCQVDNSGKWLMIKESTDPASGVETRIINLETGGEADLRDRDGAGGHSDSGTGYMIAADQWNAQPNAIRLWKFGADPLVPGPIVYSDPQSLPGSVSHFSHANTRTGLQPEQQYACGSSVSRMNGPRANEIICFTFDGSLRTLVVAPVMTDLTAFGGGDPDAKMPTGNLDVTGEYFIWTSNMGGSRQDAFIVRVPAQQLAAATAVVTGVSASSITDSGATINWTTDIPTDSQIDYGATAAYGSSSALDSSLVTSHAVVLSGLAQGTLYHYMVRSRDAAGNLTVSRDSTFTTSGSAVERTVKTAALDILDTTPPSVSITAPANAATLSGNVAVSATASDNILVVGVQFQIDGAPFGIEDFLPPYSASWNTTTAAEGSHTVTAVARDAAGNRTTSAAVTVTVANDTNAPVISAVAATGVTSTGATINWTTNEASDSQVDYGPTTAYGSSTALNPSQVTSHAVALSGLAGGNLYHYRVRSRDASGNLATSGDFTFTTTDGAAPAVAITAPATGATVSGAVTVSANASDNVGVAGVQFALDGAPLGAEDIAAPYTVSWNTTTSTNSSHTLTAVARDAAGNRTTSAAVTVTVANDTNAPVISAVAATGVTSSGATINWTTNEASDSQVDYGPTTGYGNSTTLNPSLVTSHAVALGGLAGGNLYHYRVRSRDASGNLATSGDFTFTTADGAAPAVTITAPATGATVSGAVTVSANASDNIGVAGVQFALDGAPLGAEDIAAPYTVSWDSSTAANGSHTLTAIARDTAGNRTTSASVTVTVAAVSGNLTAAYAFDEGTGSTTADASPTRNAATLSSATWRTGCHIRACLAFDGIGSFVEASDRDELTPGTQATFEAWVSLSAAPPETAMVFNKWSETVDDEYVFGVDPNLTLHFAWKTTGDGVWGTPSFNSANSVGAVPLNALTHIAVVRNGATLTFYINGTPEAPLNVVDTNPFRNGINTLRIGAQNRGGQARFWNGLIDEARIYNRALTQSEIQTDLDTPIGPASNDTTPPVISAASASSISASGATIGWTTNEASDSQVDYGPTAAYGSSSPLDNALVTTHAAALAGLTANTVYHYRVRSRDAAGNLATSADLTFNTTDTTAPAVSITAPAGGSTVSGAMTVSANASDNVGVAGVQFELDGAPLAAEDTTAPYAVSWNSATATDGNHTLTAVARDRAGNQTRSATVTVTVSNAPAQVRLAWDANTDSSLVGYKVYVGNSSGGYSVGTDVGNVTTYTVTGLQRGHHYYFVVTAYDQDGNESGFSNEVDTVP